MPNWQLPSADLGARTRSRFMPQPMARHDCRLCPRMDSFSLFAKKDGRQLFTHVCVTVRVVCVCLLGLRLCLQASLSLSLALSPLAAWAPQLLRMCEKVWLFPPKFGTYL